MEKIHDPVDRLWYMAETLTNGWSRNVLFPPPQTPATPGKEAAETGAKELKDQTMNHRKKLIEVALPLEDINTQSAREKEPFTRNHPRALHIWWAPRPLAACRAVLFASLVDDPDSDPQFLKHDGSVDTERSSARRAELFELIRELVKWENSNNPTIIDAARAQIAASIASRKIYDTKEWTKDQIICRENAWAFVCRNAKPENVNAFLIAHAPPVLDPFCGRGSIPLEAQRLGLRAFGTDLRFGR